MKSVKIGNVSPGQNISAWVQSRPSKSRRVWFRFTFIFEVIDRFVSVPGCTFPGLYGFGHKVFDPWRPLLLTFPLLQSPLPVCLEGTHCNFIWLAQLHTLAKHSQTHTQYALFLKGDMLHLTMGYMENKERWGEEVRMSKNVQKVEIIFNIQHTYIV